MVFQISIPFERIRPYGLEKRHHANENPQRQSVQLRTLPSSNKRLRGFSLPSAVSGTEQRILAQYTEIARGDTNMADEEWVKTLEDGRKVKFIYQELPEDGAFITAQIAGNEVVYSVVLTKAGNPLSRENVEGHFKGELSKK